MMDVGEGCDAEEGEGGLRFFGLEVAKEDAIGGSKGKAWLVVKGEETRVNLK